MGCTPLEHLKLKADVTKQIDCMYGSGGSRNLGILVAFTEGKNMTGVPTKCRDPANPKP